MSGDPLLQAPGYSQSPNRYLYAWGNPLKYTDPSGFAVLMKNELNATGLPTVATAGTLEGPGGSGGEEGKDGESKGTDDKGCVDPGKVQRIIVTGMRNPPGFDNRNMSAQEWRDVGGYAGANGNAAARGAEGAPPVGPSVGQQAKSLALDLTPWVGAGKSAAQVITGRDLVTDEEVSRWGEAGGILLGLVPGGKLVTKGKKAKAIVQNLAQETVGGLRAAGKKDAHHVIQDAAVRDLPGYNTNAAPGIQLTGPSNVVGTPHNIATSIQRQAGGGTYAAERRIGYKAMRRAGVSEGDARSVIRQADDYFESIGVGPDTVIRIPGNR